MKPVEVRSRDGLSLPCYLTLPNGVAAKNLPLMLRIGNAFLSYASYLGQTIWPARLAVFYPHPASLSPAVVLSCALLFALVSTAGVAWRRARSRAR